MDDDLFPAIVRLTELIRETIHVSVETALAAEEAGLLRTERAEEIARRMTKLAGLLDDPGQLEPGEFAQVLHRTAAELRARHPRSSPDAGEA